MSTNLIDEMSEVEAKDTLNNICNKLGIVGKLRNRNQIFGVIENSVKSNVIKFPESESFTYIQYDGKVRGVEGKFDIGVTMHVEDDKSVSLQIDSDGVILETTRKELSQFLWAAAYFLDSNQEWAESEYPALNK